MKQRIVSGIKPSGELHLGNYLGAVRQWLTLQDEYETFLFIADLHAITVPQDPADLRRRTIEVAKTYLAAGIDPKKVTIFVQSQVPEHTELAWVFNTLARMGDLEKMTQFKDKGGENRETAGVGLFDYPVLMAADIALYDADMVPVGEDQVQHLELTRTLVRRFNKRFGELFKVPRPLVQTESARIMALDNPEKKMSKSAGSEYNYIALGDDPEKARKKIMKAVTDSGSEIVYRDDKPALKNLINIYALLSNKTTSEIEAMHQGKGYAEFKGGLADVVVEFLTDFQGKFATISDDEALQVLQDGATHAHTVASEKWLQVKDRAGLVS